jgi:hypothetical protein
MRYVVDTNIWVFYLKKNTRAIIAAEMPIFRYPSRRSIRTAFMHTNSNSGYRSLPHREMLPSLASIVSNGLD